MSGCRDCTEPCFWTVTTNGRKMLVNEAEVLGGNIELDLDRDPPLATVVKPDPLVRRHVSHFLSCPAAAKRRRR